MGHYSSTANPGQIGNFARRRSPGSPTASPFSRMLELAKGDKIIVETRQAVYTYVLDAPPRQLTVKETDTWVIDPGAGSAERQAHRRR